MGALPFGEPRLGRTLSLYRYTCETHAGAISFPEGEGESAEERVQVELESGFTGRGIFQAKRARGPRQGSSHIPFLEDFRRTGR